MTGPPEPQQAASDARRRWSVGLFGLAALLSFSGFLMVAIAFASRDPSLLDMAPGLSSLAAGGWLFRDLDRHRPEAGHPSSTARLKVLAGAACLVAVAAPAAAVQTYPRVHNASVVARDAATGAVRWRASTPAVTVFDIARDGNTLLVLGLVDDNCAYHSVTVRLDMRTGRRQGLVNADQVPSGAHITTHTTPGSEPARLRLDPRHRRVVSDRGWSVPAEPASSEVLPVLYTRDLVFLAEQGTSPGSCGT
jgi:hypothetical protein